MVEVSYEGETSKYDLFRNGDETVLYVGNGITFNTVLAITEDTEVQSINPTMRLFLTRRILPKQIIIAEINVITAEIQ